MTPRIPVTPVLFAAAAALLPSIALADTLQARPGDPAWMHLGANALLWAHIAGGAIGMVTGVVALASRKGQRVHRAAGSVFFLAMFMAYAIGAGVAPFLDTGQRPNFVAGVMALYLLVSGAMAARRRDVKAGAPEVIGLIIALSITAAGVIFMRMGAASPSGTVDGSPPQAFLLFTIAGVFAAAGELHVLMRKQLSNVSRIARHLWRMCFSLFIASGVVLPRPAAGFSRGPAGFCSAARPRPGAAAGHAVLAGQGPLRRLAPSAGEGGGRGLRVPRSQFAA